MQMARNSTPKIQIESPFVKIPSSQYQFLPSLAWIGLLYIPKSIQRHNAPCFRVERDNGFISGTNLSCLSKPCNSSSNAVEKLSFVSLEYE